MNQIVKDLEKNNADYRSGNPTISDAEYDLKVSALKSAEPNHPFLMQVEAESDFGQGKIRHDEPMLSTDKAYSLEEIQAFVSKVSNAAEKIGLDPFSLTYRVTPKLDGMAGKRTNSVLATRGDGLIGNNVTSAFDKGVIDLSEGESAVGEIVMTQDYFDSYLSDLYSHPRNVTVGIVSADTPNSDFQKALAAKAVRFVPYNTLEAWEGDGESLLVNLDSICSKVANCGYPIDGTVIEVTNEKLKQSMGSTSHHHNWQIAKKERGEVFNCLVQGITWQVGRTGRVTPVINIVPTKISGALVSNVTGHHAANILDKKIGTGATIEVVRSGEVIPFLSKVVETSDKVSVPDRCPCCDSPLVTEDLFLRCDNLNCSAQTQGKIIHWFKILGNVDGFGPSAVDKLTADGFDSALQIYQELTSEIAIAAGFGSGQAANLMSELKRSQTDRIDDWRFLAAFGIHRLGRGDSKKLLKHVSIYDLDTVTEGFLLSIEGFGPISSKSISDEINQRIDEINQMLELDFNLEITGETQSEESPITGKHIVFTGGMVKGTRDAMKAHAESLGAIPQSSINKKTQILVAGNKSSAAKVAKAEGLGATVYTEDEYLQALEG